jgi:hypothetical protein
VQPDGSTSGGGMRVTGADPEAERPMVHLFGEMRHHMAENELRGVISRVIHGESTALGQECDDHAVHRASSLVSRS